METVLAAVASVCLPTMLLCHVAGRRSGVPLMSGPARWQPIWRAEEFYRPGWFLVLWICTLAGSSAAFLLLVGFPVVRALT